MEHAKPRTISFMAFMTQNNEKNKIYFADEKSPSGSWKFEMFLVCRLKFLCSIEKWSKPDSQSEAALC